jgi:hypothetical protein
MSKNSIFVQEEVLKVYCIMIKFVRELTSLGNFVTLDFGLQLAGTTKETTVDLPQIREVHKHTDPPDPDPQHCKVSKKHVAFSKLKLGLLIIEIQDILCLCQDRTLHT